MYPEFPKESSKCKFSSKISHSFNTLDNQITYKSIPEFTSKQLRRAGGLAEDGLGAHHSLIYGLVQSHSLNRASLRLCEADVLSVVSLNQGVIFQRRVGIL